MIEAPEPRSPRKSAKYLEADRHLPPIVPKTVRQADYLRALRTSALVVATALPAPAGCIYKTDGSFNCIGNPVEREVREVPRCRSGTTIYGDGTAEYRFGIDTSLRQRYRGDQRGTVGIDLD